MLLRLKKTNILAITTCHSKKKSIHHLLFFFIFSCVSNKEASIPYLFAVTSLPVRLGSLALDQRVEAQQEAHVHRQQHQYPQHHHNDNLDKETIVICCYYQNIFNVQSMKFACSC